MNPTGNCEEEGKENAKASELVKARADLEKAQRDEEATKKASERASRKLEKAEADLKTKTQEAEDATGDFAQAQESAEASSAQTWTTVRSWGQGYPAGSCT